MFFDFSFYLLIALVVLLSIIVGWSLSKRWRESQPTSTPTVVTFAKELLPLLLIVFVLRGFILEPFRIPSGSMLPNLQAGDLILVSKFDYGIRWPILNSVAIATGQPERGDILVFYHPQKTELHYIKRVIGLPGDAIEIEAGQVSINGIPLAHTAHTHQMRSTMFSKKDANK